MIQIEGNGGGDYLDLKVVSKLKGCIHVKSGHCCVTTINKILPVEVLTKVQEIKEIDRGKPKLRGKPDEQNQNPT